MKRVLFYANHKNTENFLRGYYQNDIQALSIAGYEVIITNKVRDALKWSQYDCLVPYFWTFSVFAAIIAKILGKKVVFNGAIADFSCDQKIYKVKVINYLVRIFFKLGYHFSDKTMAMSNAELLHMKKLIKNHEKLVYSPLSSDLVGSTYQSDEIERKHNFITISWMGDDYTPIRKGVDKLLYFMREYLKLMPEAKAYIIGTPGEGTIYLKRIIAELGLEKSVCFTGVVDEDKKLEYLKSNLFYWQVSEYEGFGVAALEALASGSTVIHSNRGGLSDVVGKHGCIVDCDHYDPQQLAKEVYGLAMDKSAREKLLFGLETHLQKFTQDARARSFKDAIG
ncbi:glycosyltransferase family 4 protein [Cysteiniphilum halobium]|uniref:glycosyltransferase family 4 protein n=1 Tax=Cysteiniphilum halobium TaxID=2219059 RepID=UPI000E655F38|nr:glycosyltransferase family 4 protein [Cysteiniphilum halobium]